MNVKASWIIAKIVLMLLTAQSAKISIIRNRVYVTWTVIYKIVQYVVQHLNCVNNVIVDIISMGCLVLNVMKFYRIALTAQMQQPVMCVLETIMFLMDSVSLIVMLIIAFLAQVAQKYVLLVKATKNQLIMGWCAQILLRIVRIIVEMVSVLNVKQNFI